MYNTYCDLRLKRKKLKFLRKEELKKKKKILHFFGPVFNVQLQYSNSTLILKLLIHVEKLVINQKKKKKSEIWLILV